MNRIIKEWAQRKKKIKKETAGITLIALVITIVVLLIITGVTIGSITKDESIITEAKEGNSQAQKESILEQIEADLYTEKIKKGKNITKSEAEAIISNFGEIDQTTKKLTTTDGGYEIALSEIIGWNQAD